MKNECVFVLLALLAVSCGGGSSGSDGVFHPPGNVDPELANTTILGDVETRCETQVEVDGHVTCVEWRFVVRVRAINVGPTSTENTVLTLFSVNPSTEELVFSRSILLGRIATDSKVYWIPGDSHDVFHEVVSEVNSVQTFTVSVVSHGWEIGHSTLMHKGVCDSVSRPDLLRCFP